jgi:hypothetical protein
MSQKINSLFFFGHCAQSCGYIDNMSKICRVCSVLLNAENCVPSFLKRNNVICRACDQNQANERTRKQRLIILNNLGGECQCCHMQNIDLLSIDHIYGGGHQENKNISWKKYIRTLFHLPVNYLWDKPRGFLFLRPDLIADFDLSSAVSASPSFCFVSDCIP